jgi:DNA polymerase I-like protein with 3'-5' exonuclease and polymerase domains
MCSPVATPTGRIRGGVGFTAARNTPFQGLAADGAKLAMWELVKAGYRIAAFVHDEFVIELPIQADHTAAAQKVEHICCIAMQQLLGDIPVSCEYALADRWYKAAAAVTDDTGKLVQWQPGKPN